MQRTKLQTQPKFPARESTCQNCKTKSHIAKGCRFERRRKQECEENTELEETEENDTVWLINMKTENKHVFYRRKHITMAIKNAASEEEFIVDTPAQKNKKEQDIITDNL